MKIASGSSNATATLVISMFISSVAFAQTGSSTSQLKALASWIALDAPTGWEHVATDILIKARPGWTRDESGNLILRKGAGTPRRVVACALDRPGFAVTEITDSGYLRLREVGSMRLHPLWTQFHEGQRIRVITRAGGVPGVSIVRSTHLQRGRAANLPIVSLDDIWVDVGASTKADVRRMGIQLLDPVVRDFPVWTFGDFVAGPGASTRVGCAAVFQAASGDVAQGETIFILSTLRSFGHDGLEAVLRRIGKIDELTLVDTVTDSTSATSGVLRRRLERPNFLPDASGITAINVLSPVSRYHGTLVESVKLEHANELRKEIEKSASVTANENRWLELPTTPDQQSQTDAFSSSANLLKALADIPAVSGHEGEIRAAIQNALPAWARERVKTDSEGNLILEFGPDRDPVMFIAHMDEVGFEITSIENDGTVALRTRGGLYPSLWEGQTALIHFDRGSAGAGSNRNLAGIFVPRDQVTTKQPTALTAWFGVDGQELKRLGVAVGQSVTSFKSASRIGPNRFTARALDDRAGSTALILAAARMNPAVLSRRVIFAWSVREETGLEGAIAMAKHYGPTLKRVFSVDTFVSSDSPVETTRFANTPLGDGAVLRALDSSSVTPPAEIDRILRIGRLQTIPLQVGATNGGADGSDFVRYGVTHVGLSWPGRYSHSPVEVLDLRDLDALVRLIRALASAGH